MSMIEFGWLFDMILFPGFVFWIIVFRSLKKQFPKKLLPEEFNSTTNWLLPWVGLIGAIASISSTVNVQISILNELRFSPHLVIGLIILLVSMVGLIKINRITIVLLCLAFILNPVFTIVYDFDNWNFSLVAFAIGIFPSFILILIGSYFDKKMKRITTPC